MKKNSIISIILHSKNVNLYCKILIFLYYRNKNDDFLISDNIICKYLNIPFTKYYKKKIAKCLQKMEEEKIIKIKIKQRRRFYKWNLNQEIDYNDIIIPDFNWLESAN